MSATVPHRIVVAPSGFKESLSPEEVCRAVAAGVRRVLPGAHIDELGLSYPDLVAALPPSQRAGLVPRGGFARGEVDGRLRESVLGALRTAKWLPAADGPDLAGGAAVLVPGLTDDPATIAPIADYAASLPTVSRVEVLPFHQMGRDKWAELGLDYALEDARPPEASEVESAKAIFRSRGLTVH